ncbi:DNA-binding GntR family transcriptional regulator [Lipingzhangella halophila]|uniref:DNA-binding GntR family transcriptional regulator n=1 Tax=Lipingzhangella halophila TaxID=1783352 RepID=A0A7W7RM06_9ACTN|nr:GntR family transcriptional regulator [Lipingzhangella halophila]MBB4934458.1 DNA-binding GntR family transcriptional regulator [Lipingzhangella halophila]
MGVRSRNQGTSTSRDVVAAELRRGILDLAFEPGSSLAENEIATELGVSRTPVREAVILLAQEGLVEIYPQVGTFVSRIDPAAVADAQFIREALELASLRDLVETIDESKVRRLRSILDRQKTAVAAKDADQFFELDEELHRTMLELAGHGAAWATVSSAKGHLNRARRACLPVADTLERMLEQHSDIVEKLASTDPGSAEAALQMHLRQVFRDIDVVKARVPQYFATGPSRPTRRARLS